MKIVIKLKLLVLVLFSATSFATEPVWYTDIKNIEVPKHIINTEKQYYYNKLAVDTRKSGCSGQLCFPQNTEITCKKYSYVNYSADTELQFCHVDRYIAPGEKPKLPDSGMDVTTITALIRLDKNGKRKSYTYQFPKNLVVDLPLDKSKASKPIAADVEEKVPTPPPPAPSSIPKPKITKPEIAKPTDSPPPIEEAEGGVTECDTGNCNGFLQVVKEVQEKLSGTHALESDIAKTMNFNGQKPLFPKLCAGFFNEKGAPGPWANEVIRSLKTVCSECFFGENHVAVEGLCPKFDNFSQKEKEYFWIWTYSSMSHVESSCRKNAKARGRNDQAVGLLQLEQSWGLRSRRGPECNTRPGENVYSTTFQFRCGASIIRDTRWADKKPLAGTGGQYWQKLQTSNGAISRLIAKFPGCK